MKNLNFVVFAMIFLATLHQKATAQDELKIVDYALNPICKDTSKAPKDLLSFANAIQNNQVDFLQSGVSNMDWANKVCEGFNYRASTRLGMEKITPGMLIKMLKDTAHCRIKYLNVKKDLLLNSGVDPNTSNIEWQKMKDDVAAQPYIVYESPYNSQEAVLAKWKCRCNPQADLREAIPEEKLADNNDDVYFTPDKNSGISDATAHADANAEAKVVIEYVPQGATNFQQYNPQCGCNQPYYPQQQQYCYTPSYNSGLFVGVQILFTFQWGGQTYNAYDPNDQVVQNIVNNYITNNYIVNNYGTSDSTSTDTGGATNGNDGGDDGGVVDNGGATNGTDGGATNGSDGGGRKSSPGDNHSGYAVETLDANPVVSNVHAEQNHQVSNLGGTNLASNAVGNSVHNAQTLDANPGSVNVNGVNHVATLSGNGNPVSNVNGVSHGVTNLDPNPTFASVNGSSTLSGNGANHAATNLNANPVAFNSTNPNVFDVNHTQYGSVGYQQSGNNNVYTASANNGTFDPTNYSQGVQTFSHNGQQQQFQTNQTQPQGQWNGYSNGSAPTAMNTNGNFGNGTYQNYDPNFITPAVKNNHGTNGYATTQPRGNISYAPQQANLQQLHPNSSGNNGNFGTNLGTTASLPVRNLNFAPAPKFNFTPVQKGSSTGARN